ncbi:hypothetical protein RND81_09G101200 [Saponaria officinalis]|uniref:Uncharacterized protein n=1 Tax=Saponaria officinalis TaxID=3572 RepID=A0AAW1IIW5_SAPOF
MSSSSSSAFDVVNEDDSSDQVVSDEVQRSDDVVSSEVGDDDSENPPTAYVVKCRTRKLVDMMSKLNESQKAAVNSIGFGGLFYVGFKHFPTKFVNHFVDAFNDRSHVFRAADSKFVQRKMKKLY